MLKNILQKNSCFRPLTSKNRFCSLQSGLSDEFNKQRSPYKYRRQEIDWSNEENALQAVIPEIKEDILDDQLEDYKNAPHLRKRYSKLLDKRMFDLPYEYHSGALATVHSYLQLKKFGNVSPEHLKLSCILAWCYRLQVSSMILYDDILDEHEMRYNEKSWYKQVGTKEALLDILFLESSATYLFLRYFKSQPQFLNMLRLFNKNYATSTIAQMLEIQTYNMEDLEAKQQFVKSLCVTLYPIRSVMYLLNIVDPDLHYAVEQFCFDLGQFIKAEDDIWSAFEPTTKTQKDCTDTNKGRVTWLNIQVVKHGTTSQKQKFSENFGKSGETAARNVHNIYEEIGMKEHYKKYEEEFYNKMWSEHIERLPKYLPKQLFTDLLDYALIKKFRG